MYTILNAKTGGIESKILKVHENEITSVCFSLDGTKIVTGSVDRVVIIWDAKTGGIIGKPLIGDTYCITCLCFSSDRNQIVVVTEY